MSSVWLTSVLPAVVTGVATTLITLIATRASDRRKFRNDALLASIEQRRHIYETILAATRKWQISRWQIDSFIPSGIEDRQAQEAAKSIDSALADNELKIPANIREQAMRTSLCLLRFAISTLRFTRYADKSKRTVKYIPFLVAYFIQAKFNAWTVHSSINTLAKSIDSDLGW